MMLVFMDQSNFYAGRDAAEKKNFQDLSPLVLVSNRH